MRANGALLCRSGLVRIDPLPWHAERTPEADGAGGSIVVPRQEFKSGNHVNSSRRPTWLAAVANVHVGRSSPFTRFGSEAGYPRRPNHRDDKSGMAVRRPGAHGRCTPMWNCPHRFRNNFSALITTPRRIVCG